MLIFLSDTLLGRNIRYLRKEYCVSRRALSRLINMSDIRIRDFEEEITGLFINDRQLHRLCAVFEMSAEDLLHKDLSAKEDT